MRVVIAGDDRDLERIDELTDVSEAIAFWKLLDDLRFVAIDLGDIEHSEGACKDATTDVIVTTSGCMGLCSREPLVTVELLGKEPIKYEKMNEMRMRQVFKRHVLEGEIQTDFVLAKGAEVVR